MGHASALSAISAVKNLALVSSSGVYQRRILAASEARRGIIREPSLPSIHGKRKKTLQSSGGRHSMMGPSLPGESRMVFKRLSILAGRADVVYGSRIRGGKPVREFSILYLWGNKFVTLVANLLYGSALTDMETGYKVIRADVIKRFPTCAGLAGKWEEARS